MEVLYDGSSCGGDGPSRFIWGRTTGSRDVGTREVWSQYLRSRAKERVKPLLFVYTLYIFYGISRQCNIT